MADSFLDGIARHLADKTLIDYRPDDTGGDTFLEGMPSGPDRACALTIYDAGDEPDSLLPYDEPRLQVRTRAWDPSESRDWCADLYGELNGLGPVDLPDGTRLILSVALQPGPASIGKDQNGRHEHSCNFRMERYNPTTHRP